MHAISEKPYDLDDNIEALVKGFCATIFKVKNLD